jgi:hypothetical protein
MYSIRQIFEAKYSCCYILKQKFICFLWPLQWKIRNFSSIPQFSESRMCPYICKKRWKQSLRQLKRWNYFLEYFNCLKCQVRKLCSYNIGNWRLLLLYWILNYTKQNLFNYRLRLSYWHQIRKRVISTTIISSHQKLKLQNSNSTSSWIGVFECKNLQRYKNFCQWKCYKV